MYICSFSKKKEWRIFHRDVALFRKKKSLLRRNITILCGFTSEEFAVDRELNIVKCKFKFSHSLTHTLSIKVLFILKTCSFLIGDHHFIAYNCMFGPACFQDCFPTLYLKQHLFNGVLKLRHGDLRRLAVSILCWHFSL